MIPHSKVICQEFRQKLGLQEMLSYFSTRQTIPKYSCRTEVSYNVLTRGSSDSSMDVRRIGMLVHVRLSRLLECCQLAPHSSRNVKSIKHTHYNCAVHSPSPYCLCTWQRRLSQPCKIYDSDNSLGIRSFSFFSIMTPLFFLNCRESNAV